MEQYKSLLFTDLKEFNNYLKKTTLSDIKMHIDFMSNEWVWEKDKERNVTEFNINDILKEKLNTDNIEIVVDIDGYFEECKIAVLYN